MTDGTITEWKKKEGDKINAGDIIADVQTDKAVVEFEATDDVYLAKILVDAGVPNLQIGHVCTLWNSWLP